MQQTAQQIRIGGMVALGVGVLNLLIFGLLSLVEHNGHFILAALPAVVVVGTLGAVYTTQAERMAQQFAARPAKPAHTPAVNHQALRRMGTILAQVGVGLFVIFAIIAVITQNALFFLAAIAPGLLLGTMGLLYILTTPAPKR
jgi:hypothetical protein